MPSAGVGINNSLCKNITPFRVVFSELKACNIKKFLARSVLQVDSPINKLGIFLFCGALGAASYQQRQV